MAHSNYERIEHAGAAPETTLASTLAASALSCALTSGTGYPTGGTGKFVLVIDPETASEEKVLCSARSGGTVTIDERGFDSTSDVEHAAGAVVRHVFSATEADEANQAVAQTLGKVTTAEDLLVATGGTGFKRLGIGGEARALVVSSSAVAWGQLQTNGIADAAVTNAKLAGSIAESKLVDNVVYGLDGTTLTNDGPAVSATWEQWGTEEATVSDPGAVAVKVKADLTGYVDGQSQVDYALAQCRVQISIDGGSTWSDGVSSHTTVIKDTGSFSRQTVSSHHFVSGTASGDIQARAQLRSSETTTDYNGGMLTVLVTSG